MKLVFLILKTHLKSASSALRNDTRTKIAWFITLSISCGIGLWSISQLLDRVSQWQEAGPTMLETHLWLLCFGAWVGIGLFTALSSMTLGFGGDKPRLLMTLPIHPAARFRALYGLMFFEGIGNWLLLEVIVIGVPLTMILGLQALKWLLLLLLGVAVAVWMSIFVILLMIRYVLPHLKTALLVVLVSCTSVGIIYLAFHMVGIIPHLSAFSTPEPLHMSLLLIMVLVLVVGPCANFSGKLYVEAFHEMEGRSRSRSVINLPGVRLLSKWLKQHRNLTGALLVKGLLNQSRNAFTWGRAVMVLVCIALFPFARTLLAPYRFSNMLLVVIYSSGLAILAMIDYAPYAISSEGTRLSIYLVAPLKMTTYLRAKLIVFLVPVLFIGLALTLYLVGG